MSKKIKKFILFLGMLSVASCNFFEPTLDNVLDEDESYSSRGMVYASFVGLYSLLQTVAPDIIVMSELRGDLVMPTASAPDSFWEIYNYDIQAGNAAASPAALYNLVVNCNDFLRNVTAYNMKYPDEIPVVTYKQLIAGAVTLRTWAYLNIGKIYGEAYYFDYSMNGEMDLDKLDRLTFEQLIPELIYFMNTGVDDINGMRVVNINNIFGTSGIWTAVPINPDALMLELYLWNKDFELAAKKGINMITGQAVTAAGDANSFTCSYLYGSPDNGTNQWHHLFSRATVAANGKEGATIVLYDSSQRQPNPLCDFFSADPNSLYYLKPSSQLRGRFTGRDYQSGINIIADPRGQDVTYADQSGNSVVYKYLKARTIENYDAPVYIYRASEVFLMIAEALAALGNYDAADALINEGFNPYWVSGNKYDPPFDAPIYGFEKMRQSRGVRGRLDIPAVRSTDERFMGSIEETDVQSYNEKRHAVLDSLIIEETGRELAAEGKRWFTMMRIARNSDRPEMLAGFVSRKFSGANREHVYEMMKKKENWFIDYQE